MARVTRSQQVWLVVDLSVVQLLASLVRKGLFALVDKVEFVVGYCALKQLLLRPWVLSAVSTGG